MPAQSIGAGTIFREGASAVWLHDLLKTHVSRLLVCDPQKAALLKEGNKSDRIDAQGLADLLRTNPLKPVYPEEHGIPALKDLARAYLTITKDVTRVVNRINALYSSCGLPCSGISVYAPPSSRQVAGQARGTLPDSCSQQMPRAMPNKIFVSGKWSHALFPSSSYLLQYLAKHLETLKARTLFEPRRASRNIGPAVP